MATNLLDRLSNISSCFIFPAVFLSSLYFRETRFGCLFLESRSKEKYIRRKIMARAVHVTRAPFTGCFEISQSALGAIKLEITNVFLKETYNPLIT